MNAASPEPVFSPEDRVALRDSVRRFLLEHWPADRAVANALDGGAIRGAWKALAGQGLTSLLIDPASGGLREAVIVLQELGRAACPIPVADALIVNVVLASSDSRGPAFECLSAMLQAGDAIVCVGLGRHDPDPASSIRLESSHVHGSLEGVEAAESATHFFFPVDDEGFAVVDSRADGVRVVPTRSLGEGGVCRVEFDGAFAEVMKTGVGEGPRLLGVARLLLAARAWGAADRAFEMVLDYVKQRRQFGQPVGRFQAVQHKLADNLIGLSGVRLGIENAAEHYDRGAPEWLHFCSATWSFACEELKRATLQTHHGFGAIGYAEDHEAPRHFRRVHRDMTRLGGTRAANASLAASFLDTDGAEFPEFDFGPETDQFRQQVRSWLDEHWPRSRRRAYEASDLTHREYDAAFAREVGETGWIGLTWPKCFGGMERSPFDLLVYMEEMDRAGAPRAGAPIQSAALMAYATPEQQARYLPELLAGQVIYGMWYSEPDSGSDLASLRTRAEREGDHWVINGQKIWTTTYFGDYMWLAARTDPQAASPHAGISMFVVPTDTPGITRQPMRTMYDGEFCNTFLDNVRVPEDALVGPLHGGWKVLVGSLGTERAYVGGGIAMKTARQFEAVCDYLRQSDGAARDWLNDAVVRDQLGRFAGRIEIGRLLALNSVKIFADGKEPTWEAAMAKVFASELMESFGEVALDLIGVRATLSDDPCAPLGGRLEQKLRHSLMWVISIGTNEIQRSLIAQRGLGLPR